MDLLQIGVTQANVHGRWMFPTRTGCDVPISAMQR
jgi:hypothetical protein